MDLYEFYRKFGRIPISLFPFTGKEKADFVLSRYRQYRYNDHPLPKKIPEVILLAVKTQVDLNPESTLFELDHALLLGITKWLFQKGTVHGENGR